MKIGSRPTIPNFIWKKPSFDEFLGALQSESVYHTLYYKTSPIFTRNARGQRAYAYNFPIAQLRNRQGSASQRKQTH